MKLKRHESKFYELKDTSIGIRMMVLFALCIFILNAIVASKLDASINVSLGSSSEMKAEKVNDVTNESYKLISVPYISQAGGYPTGCEIVSAVMLLQYYDCNISVDEFIDNYLESSFLEEIDGKLYGPNPNEAFVGDPRSIYSYGCYAPVIVKSLIKVLGTEYLVENTTGSELNELIENYIDKEIPVLIWASIELSPTYLGTQWYIEESGESFQWISNEHCMVLVGYDKDKYYFNDPYEDNGVVGYDKELVEERFNELGKQSVVILHK